MKTDTTEKGLETLIMRHMTGSDGLAPGETGIVAEAAPANGGSGWFSGNDSAYDREITVDVELPSLLFIACTGRKIELTQECSTRLTTDRMTGRLVVREVASSCPSRQWMPPNPPPASRWKNLSKRMKGVSLIKLPNMGSFY